MRYGEEKIAKFNPERDLELWPNSHEKDYLITITLPEFTCLCPQSGYPDFATFTLQYTPDKWLIELRSLKLYINTFRNRHISHEDGAHEVYDTLHAKLQPRRMKLTADFNPRGNVHTIVEIDSTKTVREAPEA